ncbi:MAG TPA: glycine cleavage T C-terminal barrel domain-containing protein [Jiangellaceae bacterium]
MTTYRSPLLDRPGAVPGTGVDAAVPGHYGDPFREQRRLIAGEAAVDLSHRDVIRISGPDRLGWLHSLATQHLESLPPHEATVSLFLSPQGRVEHALYAVDDGESFWAHVEPCTAAELVEFLDSMRFMMRVEVTDVSADYAIVWDAGRAADPERLTRIGARGREVFVPRGELSDFIGAAPAGLLAHEALRIAAREPRFGFDTDERTIPHEVGWIGTAVHLDKGCYRGQETVARVHTLGRPPRRLVMLHLDGSAEHLPPHGAEVSAEGRKVGYVGSSARHYELGPIALAVIKRNVAVDAELVADGVAAAQEVIVDPEIGLHVRPAAADASVTRPG